MIDQFIKGQLAETGSKSALAALAEEETRARLAHRLGKDTLYRYRSLREEDRDFAIDIIANHRVYFASPSSFNDPFDCGPAFRLGGDSKDPQFVKKLLKPSG